MLHQPPPQRRAVRRRAWPRAACGTGDRGLSPLWVLSLHSGDPPGGCCPCTALGTLPASPGDPPRRCRPCAAVTLPPGCCPCAVAGPEGGCDTRGSCAVGFAEPGVPCPPSTPSHPNVPHPTASSTLVTQTPHRVTARSRCHRPLLSVPQRGPCAPPRGSLLCPHVLGLCTGWGRNWCRARAAWSHWK